MQYMTIITHSGHLTESLFSTVSYYMYVQSDVSVLWILNPISNLGHGMGWSLEFDVRT